MNNLSIKVGLLNFGKRDDKTGRQDREHSVAIFGTTRNTPHTNPEIKLITSIAKKLAQNDFDVWTGGSPGIAHAANQAVNQVNPKASWAVHVARYMDSWTMAVRNKKIYNEKQTKTGVFMEILPSTRTVDIINECDHAIFASGGIGTQQELSVCCEAKLFKSSDKDLCANDMILINNNGFYDPFNKYLDNVENVMNPQYEQLNGFPLKTSFIKKNIINNEVKINKKALTDKEIEKLSTKIVDSIIEKADKNSH